MKLHELRPAEGAKKVLKEQVEVLVPVQEETLVKVKKDNGPDLEVE